MNSFLQGKKTLSVPPLRAVATPPKDALVPAGKTTTPRATTPAPCPGSTPTVEAVKEGDKVVRLIVTCTCGERVEIECLYPAGA